jgi:4-diphosphocytidyl-2-C-methyl-D-erythritol kinase
MITFPNAKINLGLNIVEKRPDGYHNLETIFYPINLQDALEVTRRENNDKEYTLHISGSPLEGEPEDNLVVKAYKLLKKDYPGLLPVDIHMYKHIPAGAGLGGGSSDAACIIKLLNDKFSLGLSTERMEEYAVKLGADCAFFIRNKPVFATGIGNLFEPVELSLKGYHIILIKPDIFVSTRDAFAEIKPVRPAVSLKEVVKQPIETWKSSMKNDFEDSVFKKFPEIAAIKDELYDLGAVYAAMSGSGSSVYGIFKAPIENVEDKFCGCFCRQRALE